MSGIRDPEVIRQDIERSRDQLGDAVDALAAKVDLRTRARERLQTLADRWGGYAPLALVGLATILLLFTGRRRDH